MKPTIKGRKKIAVKMDAAKGKKVICFIQGSISSITLFFFSLQRRRRHKKKCWLTRDKWRNDAIRNTCADFRFVLFSFCNLSFQVLVKALPHNFELEFEGMRRLICDCGKHHGRLHTHHDGKARTSVYVPRRERVSFYCFFNFMSIFRLVSVVHQRPSSTTDTWRTRTAHHRRKIHNPPTRFVIYLI
jgi:hypothetical protein